MRTLKKTLSLLLAVALVLSLTVVGASAAYTGNKVDTLKDAADVGADYSEAVGVMVGLGIIEGYDDGTLRPETTYTREQAAKIIAYMQLGPKDADSLRCTKAPFTDVAADRWSAGYIAYCVEQGIIDGMGDGTFQPEAQLTGYQWAKMLLCAVGYGRNDEYVGSSWSLNTAKDALDKGIFDGDLVGADHTPLQRQQAILYAFNALTNEKASVVVYSPSLGDYITKYGDFADRVTYEGTLGWNVYKLASNTGIIVDNEGMGNATTVLSSKYTAGTATDADAYVQCAVAANTDLDMMYHAAKIWHVNGKTAVYVMDLATVEALTCNGITKSAVAKLEKGKTVTDKTIGDANDTLYEYNLIDNTAISANYAAVDFLYDIGTLGTRSETKDTTVVDGTAYANSEIKTDISKVNRGAEVIYIATKSTTSTGEACHVYPVTYTTAKVADFSRVNKTITLSDGTVLNASVFVDANWLNDVEVGATTSIALDTHGHFISLNAAAVRTVAYYTGTARNSTAHDVWYSDAGFVAQFADLATGKPIEVPVTAEWLFDANTKLNEGDRGYYDITDTLLGTDNYEPSVVTEANNGSTQYANYAFKTASGSVAFTATSYRFDANGTNVYFDNDEVTFILASGVGSTFDTEVITGVDNLLAYFSEDYAVHTVTLSWLAMTGAYDAQGVFYADTIFAFTGATVSSGTLFYPTDVNDYDVIGGLNRFEGGYLNGTKTNWPVYLNGQTSIKRGFYTFNVDANGVYTLDDVNHEYGWSTVMHKGSKYWINVSDTTAPTTEGYDASNAVVVDLRTGPAIEEVDTIADLSDLYYDNYNDYHGYKVKLAFTVNADNTVGVIYVLDEGFEGTTTVSLSDAMYAAGWRIVNGTKLVKEVVYTDADVVATNYELTNINVDMPANTPYASVMSVTGATLTSAMSAADGNIDVVLSNIPAMSITNDVDVEIGMTAAPVEFVVDSTLGLTASVTGPESYVIGSAVELKVTLWGAYNEGSLYDLHFDSQFGDAYDIDTTVQTITEVNNPVEYTVTVYPTVAGTFTMAGPSLSTLNG